MAKMQLFYISGRALAVGVMFQRNQTSTLLMSETLRKNVMQTAIQFITVHGDK